MLQRFLLLICVIACTSAQATTLKFCYESKELLPHYRGEGVIVPSERPGAAIEIIQALDSKVENIKVEFIREPWKRCLNDLKLGKVDALIARHSTGREGFAKYPKNQSGDLDPNKSVSTSATCFIHKKNLPLEWDGKTLKMDLPQGIAIPRGYSLVDDLKKKGFQIYETVSVRKAHDLLFSGRVGTTLGDCNNKTLPSGFIENKHPIIETYGYLVFSHQFYSFYPDLTESIWNELQQIDDKAYYNKY